MRDRCDDRGAAVLEGAILMPIVFALLLGVFEYGLLYRDYLTTGDSIGESARSGAVQGNKIRYISVDDEMVGVNADFSIVQSLRQSMAGIPVESIEGIVIFRADSPTAGSPRSQVPPACVEGRASSAAHACNYYPARDAFEAVAEGNNEYFVCSGGTPSCGWPPGERGDGPVVWEIDYIGVYLKVERSFITGLYGEQFTLEQAAIQRLEPGRLEDE